MKVVDFYIIRAISNLHMGSGEGDFSVVDKQVQRDQVTSLPIMHASGIKGSLREAMEYDKGKVDNNKTVLTVFGGDPSRKNQTQQGQYNFFDAKILALPVRSSRDFYYLATCPLVLEEAIGNMEQFQRNNEYLDGLKQLLEQAEERAVYFSKDSSELVLEDEWHPKRKDFLLNKLEKIFGNRLTVLTNDQFHKIAKELPIIARNYLENGISGNLWYEEVVPREARFLTMISRENDNQDLHHFLDQRNAQVQFGANATVGYGLCSLMKL